MNERWKKRSCCCFDFNYTLTRSFSNWIISGDALEDHQRVLEPETETAYLLDTHGRLPTTETFSLSPWFSFSSGPPCPQRLPTWCWTLRWWNRPPTWRTGPCSCCSVRTRRTACPPPPTRRLPTPTAACCASPPRSTTTGSRTSGPKLADTPGCGTTVTGQSQRVQRTL